jgi:hypothetical protein
MSTLAVSYSLTGNNNALAASLAAACGAQHVRVTEAKPRKMGTIALDMLFGRTPKVAPLAERACDFDAVIFVAPVWMGSVASPLRGAFRQYAPTIGQYAFVSLSGGADGPSSNQATLPADLAKRLGKAPAALVDLHISDLLPAEPKPERKDTSAYRASEDDLLALTKTALTALRGAGLAV